MNLPIIIKGCQQNDIHCQEQLYRLYYPEMIKICFRYATDSDGAGTIYNNAMLRVFKSIADAPDPVRINISDNLVGCCGL